MRFPTKAYAWNRFSKAAIYIEKILTVSIGAGYCGHDVSPGRPASSQHPTIKDKMFYIYDPFLYRFTEKNLGASQYRSKVDENAPIVLEYKDLAWERNALN